MRRGPLCKPGEWPSASNATGVTPLRAGTRLVQPADRRTRAPVPTRSRRSPSGVLPVGPDTGRSGRRTLTGEVVAPATTGDTGCSTYRRTRGRAKGIRLRTHPRRRGGTRATSRVLRERSPPERPSRRQPAPEPRTLDKTTAERHPRARCRGVGTRDPRPVRRPSRRALGLIALQGISWRWRDLNPRLRATDWDFFGRSRCTDLTRRCPSAEDLGASPDALFPAGLRTEPAG